MNRTVAYIRYSTFKQDEARQIPIIEDRARQMGLTIDETIIDSGVSGGKDFRTRKLIDLLDTLSVGDTLLIADDLRLCRSPYQLLVIENEYVIPKGFRIVFCDTGEIIDGKPSDDSDDRQMIRTFRQYQGKKLLSYISKTSKQGIEAARAECKARHDLGLDWISKRGNVWPPGTNPFSDCGKPKVIYNVKKQSDDDWNTVCDTLIRLWKANNGNAAAVAREMNRLEFKTYRGGKWYGESVRRVIKNKQ